MFPRWELFLVCLFAFSLECLGNKRIPVLTSTSFSSQHRHGGFHVECPERISVTIEHLESSIYADLSFNSDKDVEIWEEKSKKALKWVKAVHDAEYIDEVALACKKGLRVLSPWDSDTYISRDSFETFLLAQSSWLDCIDMSMTGVPAFSLSRPPGHHALKSRSCGFCVFNYAVAAAKYALETKEGINRVAILDWDVHFGNGVSALVANNPNIRYASMHQMDIFPGGMSSMESWNGPAGNLINVGIEAGAGGEAYVDALSEKILPFLLGESFKPDLLIVCAGYDALDSDPVANVSLRPGDFYTMTRLVKERCSPIPICLGLEGGYNLAELPLAVEQTLMALSED